MPGFSAGFDPGMDIDHRIELDRLFNNHIIIGMITRDAELITPHVFDPDARPVFDPINHFLYTFLGKTWIDRDYPRKIIGVFFEKLSLFVVVWFGFQRSG